MIQSAARVVSVPPQSLVSNLWVLFIAYYVVGVIQFWRELRSIPNDDPAVKAFNRSMDSESNLQVLWIGIKLAVTVIFIHIPCWIFRI